jgi:hypothetical protein
VECTILTWATLGVGEKKQIHSEPFKTPWKPWNQVRNRQATTIDQIAFFNTGEQARSAFSMAEATVPSGCGNLSHIHNREERRKR